MQAGAAPDRMRAAPNSKVVDARTSQLTTNCLQYRRGDFRLGPLLRLPLTTVESPLSQEGNTEC